MNLLPTKHDAVVVVGQIVANGHANWHTRHMNTSFTSCTSNRVVDCIALLIVGRRGVYTSLVANGFALLRCHFGAKNFWVYWAAKVSRSARGAQVLLHGPGH